MLKVDPAQIFAEIPDALRVEWARGVATLDQICPKVRHETSAVRNEVLRRLKNWSLCA